MDTTVSLRSTLDRLLVLAATLAAGNGCAAPEVAPPPPSFAPPRKGVFVQAQPVVESFDDELEPSLSPRGARVVYAARAGGNLDIFVRPVAGGSPERLTVSSTDDTDPVFSPDGERIAWVSCVDDVKGDLWIMDADGSSKERLTGRDTADSAPMFSADGRALWFGVLSPGSLVQRIERLELGSGKRDVVVPRGWDPWPSPDGRLLFYAGPGPEGRARIFARRLADGSVAAITDGTYLEGVPRAFTRDGVLAVVFVRFVDDQNDDGAADVDDPPSLWSVDFDPAVFEGAAPRPAVPLTSGAEGEIFPAVSAGWMVYTVGSATDLDLVALPTTGAVSPGATADAVLEAARAEDDPALKRLGLRYLLATSSTVVGPARYELARDLAERGRLADALDELGRVVKASSGAELASVARLEIERLRTVQRLFGRLVARERAERDFVEERAAAARGIAAVQGGAVAARARTVAAELAFALGRRGEAVASFEDLARASGTPPEDGARALDLLGEIYARLGDRDAVARVSRDLLARFGGERFYARRAADRLVEAARRADDVPPLVALESVARAHGDVPAVAARAQLAMAELQAEAGQGAVAVAGLRGLVASFPGERAVIATALTRLGATAERAGDGEQAVEAYERLVAEYGDERAVRTEARRGLARIASRKAFDEERAGEREKARESWQRLLRNDRELVVAHRRYISLSAALGKLGPVLAQYAADAKATPRDKLARYGHGLALTLMAPPRLDEAERELSTALDLDGRFAAAHLTLGWIREQREHLEPNRGWLEQASTSYERAALLANPSAEPELWAAATLNRGNALVAIGKPDLAFDAYLGRELSGVPHDSRLSELLFRESFARTALRQDAYDVALDMAQAARRLSRRLPGEPRRAATTSLLAALRLLTGDFEEARRGYTEAAEWYEAHGQPRRVVPLLRGRALAEQALGRVDDALATTARILTLLARGDGPPEPPRPGYTRMELGPVGAYPRALTRAVYGFSPGQEEELARTQAARIYRDYGDLARARELDARRLALLREAAKDGVHGARLPLELMVGLDESARIALRAGVPHEAAERLDEAVQLAKANGWWRDLATLLDSIAWVWAQTPALRRPAAVAAAVAAAQAALQPGPIPLLDGKPDEAFILPALEDDDRRRLSRFLALQHVANAAAPVFVIPNSSRHDLAQVLERLDERVAEAELAAGLATQAGDAALAASLGARPKASADGGVVTAAGSDAPAPPVGWRGAFDAALASQGEARQTTLLAAVTAYEADPAPAWVPERPAFVQLATDALLDRKQLERAWRLLERERLLGLAPPPARLGRDALAREVADLRAARGARDWADRAAAASPLARAVVGRPATLAQLSAALEGAAFVQAFASSPREWHWFVVGEGGLGHVATAPAPDGKLPAAVSAELDQRAATAKRLVVDTGELVDLPAWALRHRERALGDEREVVEALSATYLVAARDARNLGRRGALVIGAGQGEGDVTIVSPGKDAPSALRERGAGRRVLQLGLPGSPQPAPAFHPGLAQVVFVAEPGARLDLDVVAEAPLRSSVALVGGVGRSARAARAVAQALLVAEVPTTIVGDDGGAAEALRPRLLAALASDSPAAAFRALVAVEPRAAGLRLVGDPGVDAAGRVDFAYDTLLRFAKAAAAAYKAAQAAPSPGSWRAAKTAFGSLLDAIAFMREPDNTQRLLASTDERKKKLPPGLAGLEAVNQSNLAKVHLALDEVALAAALQEKVLEYYQGAGKLKEAAQTTLALGRALSYGKRGAEAVATFKRCVELARRADDPSTEGDCLVRRGSELRGANDYAGAVRAYQEAIMLYARLGSPTEAYPRRYLGFVYESSLNAYDRALEQFEAALEVARRRNIPELVPSLLLDIARVFRQRGNWEGALAKVGEAEAALTLANPQGRAEAALEGAKIYWYRGNYRRALERQRTGLELARRAGSSFLEIQATSLAGLIALNQGELARAERAIDEALSLARLTGRRSEEAAQLNNLGIVLREAGRLPDAAVRFRAALAIDVELNSIEGRAYDLRNLAVTLERQGQHAEALEALGTALELSRSIGSRYNELQCVFAIGEVQEATGKPDAKVSYELAARQSRESAVPELEWRSLYGLGRLAEAAGDAAQARRLFDAALSVAERLGRGRSDSFAGRGRDELYEDSLRLAMAAGDTAGAFTLTERARARGVLDLVAARPIELPDARARSLARAELGAREAVLAAERDEGRGVAGAAVALEHARATLRDAGEALRRAYPALWRLFVIAPPALSALQGVLPRGTTVLDYFVGRKTTVLFVITADAVQAVRLELGAQALDERVRRLTAGLRAFAPIDAELASLATDLLAPVPPAVWAATRTLVVVPHGSLFHVPFAALPSGDDVLWARTALAQAPSAALLFDRLSDPRPGPVATVAALAPASDLPFARLEVQAIAGAAAVVGPDASESRLRGLRTDAVDLAAHVEVDPLDALASAVVLAPEAGHDGRLELRQVFGMASLPRLVTLSACSSAVSDVRGDEWVGLGYGFLGAGSRTVVATQSRVSDLAAAVVMKRFYRLLSKRSPAEALREAALGTRRWLGHPAHWATFVLIGDFR